MRALKILCLIYLSGCVHRLAVVYESEEAALTGSQIVITGAKKEVSDEAAK